MDVLQDKQWQSLEQDIISWRRELHKIPELGNELPQTTQFIRSVLDELGIPYTSLMSGNAIVGLIEGDQPGKCIALRADTDALPIKEDTGLEFASENGNMHACGHDGHAAMLLGAAAWLQAHKDQIKGSVKLLFQPGEEFPGGAEPMIKEGALENPHVDAVFGMHEGQIYPGLKSGLVGIKYGSMMAAMDRLFIKVIGKGGHGANPHLTIDPITLSAEIILSLQTIVSRENKPTEPIVLSITRIDGGYNQNVIPDVVELEGTVRTLNHETREWLSNRIKEVVGALAASRGAQVEIEHTFNYPPLINDSDMVDLAKNAALKLFGEENVIELAEPMMGGEDFAYFSNERPGAFVFLSNPQEVDGKFWGHHHPKFAVDESFFIHGAMLHAQMALDYLQEA
ncbi:MAG: M20 family metallopeptidase [Coriobacteriia bacterium]|nr:M20 family metallopeptidase [Coriobacteriia bacterium]